MKPVLVLVSAMVALGAILLAGARAPAPAPTPPRRVELAPTGRHLQRGSLPPLARSILAQKMENHAAQMTDLVWAVVFLEHDAVREEASDIAGEPKIARPRPDSGADDLSSQLPRRFFDLQDDLGMRAKELAAAASEGDDEKIAEAWARLSRACVQCHAVYLAEPR